MLRLTEVHGELFQSQSEAGDKIYNERNYKWPTGGDF